MIYERLKLDENEHERHVRSSTTQHLDVCLFLY